MSHELVTVDTRAIEQLGEDLGKGKRMLLGRLAERGYQLLRAEVPERTGNLKQGVAPPAVDYEAMEATLTVSARSGATANMMAEVFDAKGNKVKVVTLRPQAPFNYAETVAEGRAAIAPRNAQALLIPVSGPPQGEGYLLAGGHFYVVRRSAKAVPPNPFDERAATRLENEAPAIGDAVLREFVA